MGLDEDNETVEEEERHVVIPESSIRIMLEFRDVPHDILTLISEDASYMVRQVIHNAMEFMHSSGRSRLITVDVGNALNMCNGFQTFGHEEKSPLRCRRVHNFFVAEDSDIDIISSMEEDEEFVTSSSSSLNVQWSLPEKKSALGTSAMEQPSDCMMKIPDQPASGKTLIVDDINDIPEKLVVYYPAVTNAFMSHDEECVAGALDDLRRNPKICQLLPQLLTFADEEVRTLNHELRDVQKFFDFIRALMDNSFMYLGHEVNLNPLMRLILYCIIEPQEQTSDLATSHWKVRDAASALLKCIIDEWATPVNSQYEHTLPIFEKIFRDANKPLWSLYGAVVAVSNLGADAIEETLNPYISKLKRRINNILRQSFQVGNMEVDSIKNNKKGSIPGCSKGDSNPDEAKNETVNLALAQVDAAQRLYSALVNAAEVYMKNKTDSRLNRMRVSCSRTDGSHFYMDDISHKRKKPLHEVYKELYNHFGETLASRLPLSNMVIYKDDSEKPCKRRRICPSTCRDLSKVDSDEDVEDLPHFLNSAVVAGYKTKREAGKTSNADEASGSGGGIGGCDEEMDYEDEECDEDEEEEIEERPPDSCLKIKHINESQGLKVIITRVEGSKK